MQTEMYVDAFVDIAKAGKITGRNKNVDRGRQVYAFAAGTQKLYDYIKENPDVMAAPVDYTNDVQVIAKLDNFISIKMPWIWTSLARSTPSLPASSTFPAPAASWTS